jgi:methionyl-tRNA formyltransferase
LLTATLDGIESGTLEARPQPAEGISTAAKIAVSDARIDWSAPAFAVDRRIRACTPAPGAWTLFRGERLKLGPVGLRAERELAPGELQAGRDEVRAGTAAGDVTLGAVQPPGKRAMAAPDWARGARIQVGERLG